MLDRCRNTATVADWVDGVVEDCYFYLLRTKVSKLGSKLESFFFKETSENSNNLLLYFAKSALPVQYLFFSLCNFLICAIQIHLRGSVAFWLLN